MPRDSRLTVGPMTGANDARPHNHGASRHSLSSARDQPRE
jgi:hypothetical protein